MPTFKLHFAQEAISKIILPETKEDFYNDTKEKGLFLIARKSKTFYTNCNNYRSVVKWVFN